MSSCISSCARRCSLSRSRRSRMPSTKMSARRASFSPRDKAKQRKRVREKSKRKRHADGVLFCALGRNLLPHFAFGKTGRTGARRAPHKIPYKSPALPDFLFLCSRRGGAASSAAPQGTFSCPFRAIHLVRTRGGYRFRFLRNWNVSRGDSVPPGIPGTEKGRLHSQTAFSTKSR